MDDLFRSLCRALRAQKEYDKAFGDCESSWGYYGQSYQDELDSALADFNCELERYIQEQ